MGDGVRPTQLHLFWYSLSTYSGPATGNAAVAGLGSSTVGNASWEMVRDRHSKSGMEWGTRVQNSDPHTTSWAAVGGTSSSSETSLF